MGGRRWLGLLACVGSQAKEGEKLAAMGARRDFELEREKESEGWREREGERGGRGRERDDGGGDDDGHYLFNFFLPLLIFFSSC